MEPPRTLLVLKPSSFGDIVHALPAVARLRAAWPECKISWLVNTEWAPLLEGNSTVDEIIPFPRREFRGWRGLGRITRWARAELRVREPDLVLDFQGLLRSAYLGRASQAKNLWGLDDAREGARWLYAHRTITPNQPVHAVERYLALADDAIRETGAAVEAPALQWPIPEGKCPKIEADFSTPFILFHPYARGFYKTLNGSDIRKLIRKMREVNIVLAGRLGIAPESDFGDCVNLLNSTTISELIWLIRRASFVLTVDSGPAHLAAALNKPMVAIHSWSDPRRVGPYRPDAWVWKNSRLTQVHKMATMPPDFFAKKRLDPKEADLNALARLATSPADFFA